MEKIEEFGRGYIRQLVPMFGKVDWEGLQLIADALRRCHGMVWLVGNGGSLALASHIAVDLQLAGVRAVALSDPVALSCYGNDYGYVKSFSGQLQVLKKPGDVVITISTSGMSKNVVDAAQQGLDTKSTGITVTGGDGGSLQGWGDLEIHIHCDHTGVVQDVHQVLWHIICYYLKEGK